MFTWVPIPSDCTPLLVILVDGKGQRINKALIRRPFLTGLKSPSRNGVLVRGAGATTVSRRPASLTRALHSGEVIKPPSRQKPKKPSASLSTTDRPHIG